MSSLINFCRSLFHISGKESHTLDERRHNLKLPCHGHEFPDTSLLDLEYYYSSQYFHYVYWGTCHLKTCTVTKVYLYRENINTPHAYLCVEGRYQFADVDKTIYACFERSSGLGRVEDAYRSSYLPQNKKNRVLDFISETYHPRRNRTCTLCSTISFDSPVPLFCVTTVARIIQVQQMVDEGSNYFFAGIIFEVLRGIFPAEITNATGAGGSWYLRNINSSDVDIQREQLMAIYEEYWAETIDQIEKHQQETNYAMATEAAQNELVRCNRMHDELIQQMADRLGPPPCCAHHINK